MANTPISDFPAASSVNASDVLAGVQDDVTKKFSFAIVLNWLKQQLGSLFVPTSREINGKALDADIILDASDVGAVDTTDVGVADGVASLDNNGKVPGTQLDLSGKQDTITANGILKGDGAGGVSAATAGTDYGTYSKPSGGIPASDLANGVIPTVPSAYTSNPAMDGTASPGSSGAWAKGDHVHPSDTSRAPTNHASSATTYGKGNEANYGHLKLSNSTNLNSGVADGVAATPRAVKDTYDFAATKADANSYTGTFASSSTAYVSSASVSDCKRSGMLVGLLLSLSLAAQIPLSRQTFGQLHGVPTPKTTAVGVMQIVDSLFAVAISPLGGLTIEAIGTVGGNSGWSGNVTIMYVTDGTIIP